MNMMIELNLTPNQAEKLDILAKQRALGLSDTAQRLFEFGLDFWFEEVWAQYRGERGAIGRRY